MTEENKAKRKKSTDIRDAFNKLPLGAGDAGKSTSSDDSSLSEEKKVSRVLVLSPNTE